MEIGVNPLDTFLNDDGWHANRVGTLRGSDVTKLARGGAKESWRRDIIRLWKVKTGRIIQRDAKPTLPQLMGRVLEDLNARWFESETGRRVWDRNTERVHPQHPWLAVSVDAVSTSEDGREAYLELKAVSTFKDIKRLYRIHQNDFNYLISYRLWEERVLMPLLISEYTAQCHLAMACGGWKVAILCVLIGNRQFTHEIEFDPWYWCDLFELMNDFWSCVVEDREPGPDIMRGVSL